MGSGASSGSGEGPRRRVVELGGTCVSEPVGESGAGRGDSGGGAAVRESCSGGTGASGADGGL